MLYIPRPKTLDEQRLEDLHRKWMRDLEYEHTRHVRALAEINEQYHKQQFDLEKWRQRDGDG